MSSLRPTAAELTAARALIARAKAADTRLRKADELLVCAAIALRAGEFNGVATRCAAAMGKAITRPSMVTDWVARIEKLELHTSSEQCNEQRSEKFFVSTAWLAEHCPRIVQVVKLHGDDCKGSCSVRVRLTNDEIRHGKIEYDLVAEGESLEDHQRRDDRNRRREEACFLALDGAAAAEHRAKKTEVQREQRREEREGDATIIQSTIHRLVARVEREAEREQARFWAGKPWSSAWRCPAGCWFNCSRRQFRAQCVPSDAWLQLRLHEHWREQQKAVRLGDFRGPSGCRFVSIDQQVRCAALQETELRCMPSYDESFGEAEDIEEMKRDFLLRWDGLGQPSDYFDSLPRLDEREYLGMDACSSPDRFGYQHYPVGRAACARSGCRGCCYCFDKPMPPVYVHVSTHGAVSVPRAWLTIDELRRKVRSLIAEDCQSLMAESVPTYLLDRQPDLSPIGGVLQISGAVRSLVDASELASWAEELQGPILLQILASDADYCAPSAHEQSVCSALLSRCRQASDEREAARSERAQLDARTRHEAQKGCEHRVRWDWNPEFPDLQPSLQRGDLVYCPPPPDRSTEAGVAVVFDVCTAGGGVSKGNSLGPCPTGKVNLIFWRLKSQCFAGSIAYDVPSLDFTLMPPCCGRGAACPHLLLSQYGDRSWPNGDALRLQDLEAIPAAFQAVLDGLPVRSGRQKQALEGSFSNLLDPFGERKRARESEEADESEDSSSDASETEEERSAKRRVVQDDEVYMDCSDGEDYACYESDGECLTDEDFAFGDFKF